MFLKRRVETLVCILLWKYKTLSHVGSKSSCVSMSNYQGKWGFTQKKSMEGYSKKSDLKIVARDKNGLRPTSEYSAPLKFS